MLDNESIVPLPASRMTSDGLVRSAPFEGDSNLPDSADVVIIGGGICGVTAAYYMAKQGLSVVVCEKGELAAEASSRGFGWVSELINDPIKLPMAQESKRLWQEIQDDIGEVGFRPHGLTYLAGSQEEMDFYNFWLDLTKDNNPNGSRILTKEEVAQMYPDATKEFIGGLHCPNDGSIEPKIVTTSVAAKAREMGVKFITRCAVRTLDIVGGKLQGAYTEKGHIKANKVLCAGNLWSRLFCGNHGINIPQLYAFLSMGDLSPTEGPVGSGGQHDWSWRKKINGGYSLGRVVEFRAPVTRDSLKLLKLFKPMMKGEEMAVAKLTFGKDALKDLMRKRKWKSTTVTPFEKERIIQPYVNEQIADDSRCLNSDIFPKMAKGVVEEKWAGPLTITPDNMPIAGAIDEIPGFYIITGASFGLTWAPSLGKMITDLMTGTETSIDPAPFKLSRFFDGSEIDVKM